MEGSHVSIKDHTRKLCCSKAAMGFQFQRLREMSTWPQLERKIDRNSLSNHLLNMGQDQDLHTCMEGLENNMKLLLAALKIAGVEKIWIGKQNIEIHVANNLAENPKKDNSLPKLKMRAWKKNEERLGIRINCKKCRIICNYACIIMHSQVCVVYE